MVAELLTGEEQLVYRDSGYLGAEKRTEAVTRNKYYTPALASYPFARQTY